jgi:hypothetical protein
MKAAKLSARVCLWLPDSHWVRRASVSAASAGSRVMPGHPASAGDGGMIAASAPGHPAYGDMPGQLLLTDNGGLTWHADTF